MRRLVLSALIFIMTATFVATGISKGAEVRLEARLTAAAEAGDISGKADYRERTDRGRRQFSIEVEGMAPGEMHDVSVAGVIVGTVVIDGFGIGELKFDDNFEPGFDDPATRFPHNFPRLDGGELVVVGPLAGSLQPR